MITTILRNRLIHPLRPVLLSSLIKQMDGIENVFAFFRIVEEYMPEEKKRMLAMTPADMEKQFYAVFRKKHFPLIEWDNRPLENIIKGINVTWHGLDPHHYDKYFGMDDSHLLAASVCKNPFSKSEQSEGSGGSRVAVVDHLSERCEQAAQMVTKRGYSLEKVEKALAGSQYEDFVLWCRWIFSQTGNIWLDRNHTRIHLEWERKTVDELAEAWPKYNKLQAKMNKFDRWLKKDFVNYSVEVIQYINNEINYSKGKPLYTVITGGENGEEENE